MIILEKDIALNLFNLIDQHSDMLSEYIIHKLNEQELMAFRKRIDLDYVIGIFFLEKNTNESFYLIFEDWRGGDNYYIVICLKENRNPLVELHKTHFMEPFGINLEWNYNPRKQDGKNEERMDYFKQYFGGGVNVSISLPTSEENVEDFIDDVFSLVTNRLKADKLSEETPEVRFEFPEGRLYEKLHKQRERSSKIVKLAKLNMKQQLGKLNCQVCKFDFGQTYGALGEDFIEAHHTIPVSELNEDSTTDIKDIALVCSNCHQMLHRRRPWLEMNQLKAIVQASN